MSKAGRTKRIIMIVNVIALLGLSISTVYLFMRNRDLHEQISLTTEEKNKRLVTEVNKVFDLPKEDPVVAIVTDPEEFKKQYAAFDNAQAGDYLLFFRKARLNVLYRQKEKRVVKTANVTIAISVEVVGSDAAIKSAETKLAQFGNQIEIKKTVKEGVTQSFVFDVDADQKADSESIAKQMGIDVGTTLPSTITPADQTEIIIVVADSAAPTQQP